MLQYRALLVASLTSDHSNTRKTRAILLLLSSPSHPPLSTKLINDASQQRGQMCSQRQNLDPVPAAKVALLSVYLRRAPASDI
jgi:hypothetical protein